MPELSPLQQILPFSEIPQLLSSKLHMPKIYLFIIDTYVDNSHPFFFNCTCVIRIRFGQQWERDTHTFGLGISLLPVLLSGLVMLKLLSQLLHICSLRTIGQIWGGIQWRVWSSRTAPRRHGIQVTKFVVVMITQ